jgi:putative ABC transport system permease protein
VTDRPWPVRLTRRVARALARAYRHGPVSGGIEPDIDLFVDDAVTDAWRAHQWRGLVRVLGTLARDVFATRWRGPALAVSAAEAAATGATPQGRRQEMETFLHDIRQAVRRLAQTPGFTALAVVTLTLGIGLTTAVFTVVDQSILRPFAYPDIDRMVLLNERYESQQMSVSWPNFLDWKAQNTAFEELGLYRNAAVTLTGGDRPERLNGAVMSASLFTTTGIGPLLGRTLVDSDDRPGADRVMVISERLWRTHFDATPAVLGRTIVVNGQPNVIVGVVPAAMRFPSRLTDVWVALGPAIASFPTTRDNHPGLIAAGRLKPGVSVDAARTAMEVIAARLGAAYPTTNKGTHVVVRPYREVIVADIRPAFELLLGAVGLVLLVTCANLAGLMLARADARQRELAVRAALGASRARLARTLLTEATIVAAAGGLGGLLMADGAVRLFVAMAPTAVPRVDLIAVDWRVGLFALGASALAAVLFGSLPAIRTALIDLQQALRNGRDGSLSGARRLRRALVVAEVAMAFVLLVGAGLFARSLRALLDVDLGFEPARLVTMQVALPASAYPTVDAWLAFHRTLLDRLHGTAGIQAAAFASSLPLSGSAESSLIREGDPMPTPDHPPAECAYVVVSPDYFRAMGLRLTRGRAFTARDTATAVPVIVVEELLAAQLFRDHDPIGRRVAFEVQGDSPATFVPIWREIVGIVHHVRQYGLTSEPPYLQVYSPLEQLPLWMRDGRPAFSLIVQTPDAAEAVASTIRQTIRSVDPNIPVYGVAPMSAAIDDATASPRLSLLLVGVFATLALVLAIVGVYAVLLQNVAQRTREIGLRMALGARRGQVGALVARQAAGLVLAGLGLGALAALGLSHFLASMLFEVSPTDPWTLVVMAAVLAVTAGVAAAVPARRASSVDPLVALRMD